MFIMPSEHLPHAATWMAFGADASIWSASSAEKVCRNQAALALEIARFEPVNLLVTRKNKNVAQTLCMTPQQNALLPSVLILTAGAKNSL